MRRVLQSWWSRALAGDQVSRTTLSCDSTGRKRTGILRSKRNTRATHRYRSGDLRLEPLEARQLLAADSLVISEFMASNSRTLADEDGTHSDWIEIDNPTSRSVDLSGWHLTDDANDLEKWQFPSMSIGSGQHVLVFASGKDRSVAGSPLHANFKLDAAGEYLALVAPDGQNVVFEFSPEFPPQFEDISYGLAADGSVRGFFTTPTPGAANTNQPIADPSRRIVINEIMYHPSSENSAEEYVELLNAGTRAVNLRDWQISSGVDYVFPGLTIQPNQFLVVAADVATFRAKYPGVTNVVGGWQGQLSNKSEQIELVDENGTRIDRVTYADQGDWANRARGPEDRGHRGWIWSAAHDGGGKSLELINPSLSNRYGQNWGASNPDNGTPGRANSIASSDIAPLVLDVGHNPIIPRASDPVTVTARVIDEQATGVTVTLNWRVDGAAAFNTVSMQDRGQQGDETTGDGVFTATIPPQADGTVVEFYVSASDNGGNRRSWPAPSQPSGLQETNALYQVFDSFDPAAPWQPGSPEIYHEIMTAAERSEFTGIDRLSDAQMNATFITVTGTGIDVRYNAGVRIRGSGSRTNDPPNNRINLPSDRPWRNVTGLNINAVSPQNQIAGSALFRLAGLPAAESNGVLMLSNGVNLHGSQLYAHLEPIGSEFAENHFPSDSGGNLYKGRRPDESPPGGRGAGLAYFGPDPAPYVSYTKLSNESEADWSDVINLTFQLNNSPDDAYVDNISQVIDIDQWLRYLALNALLDNNEGGLVNGDPLGDDYVLYRGLADTRFVMVSHDLDTLFGQVDRSFMRATGNPALNRLLNHPAILPRYYAQLVDLIDNVLLTDAASTTLDEALRNVQTQAQIDRIKTFIADRSAFVLSRIPQDVVQELAVTSSLPVVDGFHRTTSPSAGLSGTADTAVTRSVLVNGRSAELSAGSGTWSTGGSSQTLIPPGATWNYLDNGTDQGTAWRNPGFTLDGNWKNGPAQLGYGDGDEATVVGFGGNANNKFITTYFRRTFNVPNPSLLSDVTLRLLRDDGAAVYINGVEVARDSLPPAAGYQTTAENTAGGADESTFFEFAVNPNVLVAGENVIAVEVHQANPTSSDISFDLELIGTQTTAGIPLRPGINRVLVQALDGANGSGQVIDSRTIDIWYDDGSEQTVSGTLSSAGGSIVWSAANGPYHVTANTTVATGSVLTIEPGTSVYFDPNTSLRIRGQLVAVGSPVEQIRFTRVPGANGTWNGIQFVSTTADNRITDAVIEYGVTNDGMIGLQNSSLELDHVTLDHTDRRRIRSIDSSLVVRNSTFTDIFAPDEAPTTDNLSEHIWGSGIPAGGRWIIENNSFGHLSGHNDAIDFDAPRLPNPIPQILGNVFVGGGDDALDMTGDVYVEGNVFRNFRKDRFNTDPGQSNVISASGGDFTVVRNVFENAQHVSLVKEDAFMTFVNNTVVGVDSSALYFFLQGQVAGPGRGAIVDGSIFADTAVAFDMVLPGVSLTVDHSIVPAADVARGTGNIAADPGLVLVDGEYRLSSDSPALGTGPNGLDMGAAVPAGASISGEPASVTANTSATLTVGGPAITHYRYRLNNGQLSSERPVSEPIRLSNLANGSYKVSVIGRNSAGVLQDEADATVSKTWIVNRSEPLLPRLLINEVLASNVTVLDHFGTRPDLIELHNAGTAPIDLRGMSITDDADNPGKFVFPQSQIIAPGGYLTLFADKETSKPGTHLGFSLREEGEGVYLYDTQANGGALIDSVQFGIQIPDLSIGRVGPNQRWSLNVPTPGAANVAHATGDPTTLRINEWLAAAADLLDQDFLEIYNPDPLPVSLGGLHLTDALAGSPGRHTIAPLSFVAGNGYAVFVADGDAEGGPDHLNFRLSAAQEALGLLDADLNPIDRVVYYPQTTDVSQGRVPNGGTAYQFFDLPTPGSANPQTVTSTETIIDFGDVWRYDDSGTDLGTAWRQPGFDDSSWASGAGPLGVENEPLPVALATNITLGSTTFYFRNQFTFDANPNDARLQLTTEIDDGAVVYVNGVEVLRLGMPNGTIRHSTISNRFVNEAALEGPFDIPSAVLVQGENVIAVEVHQGTQGTTDIVFGLSMESTTTRTDPTFANARAVLDGLRVTEIMYNPYEPGPLEFIELQNTGATAIDLSGVRLRGGIDFTFPPLNVQPNAFVVVAQDTDAFRARYGSQPVVAGQYGGTADDFKLSNAGERIRLEDYVGRKILEFSYNDKGAWPGRADGGGSSLEVVDVAGDYDDPGNWRSSSEFGGSPGAAGSGPRADVVVNEILAHTDPPQTDSIELFNTSNRSINIGGWFLSDSSENYKKFQIPSGTVIASDGYVVFDESDFNRSAGAAATDFALNSAHGDDVWLLQADSSGKLVRFADHVKFGATAAGVSLGRWPNGTGELFPMSALSLGSRNTGPRVGEVVISEIHYNPADPDGAGPQLPSDFEFIELYNRTTSTLDLTGWRIAGGVDLAFATGLTIGPRQTIVVVPFDPGDSEASRLFRGAYGVGTSVRLVGPYTGRLDNGGEAIRLERPDEPPLEEPTFTPHVLVDRVDYDEQTPWPISADGGGDSLSRVSSVAYGDFASSWTAGRPTPGTANLFQRQAGDANEDGQFDQFDIVLALQGAKYLSGRPATWREGDWTGDGVFNQSDVVAALQTGNYLQGPYAARLPSVENTGVRSESTVGLQSRAGRVEDARDMGHHQADLSIAADFIFAKLGRSRP